MYQFIEINQKEYQNYTGRKITHAKNEKAIFYIGIFTRTQIVACLFLILKEDEGKQYFYLPYGIETKKHSKKLEEFAKKSLTTFAREHKIFKIKLLEKAETPKQKNVNSQGEKSFYIPLNEEKEIHYPNYFIITDLKEAKETQDWEQIPLRQFSNAQKGYIIQLDLLTYLTQNLSVEEEQFIEEIRKELGDYILLESIGISFLNEKEVSILFHENYSTLLLEERKNILWTILQNELKKEGYEKVYIPLYLKNSLSLSSHKLPKVPFIFKETLLQKRRD